MQYLYAFLMVTFQISQLLIGFLFKLFFIRPFDMCKNFKRTWLSISKSELLA